MQSVLIHIENVSRIHQEDSLPIKALSEVSVDLSEGEFVALSGPSGSGKTSLLNLVGCLDRPSSGKVFLDGQEISSLSQRALTTLRRDKIGYVFQDFNLIPTLSALENVEYILWLKNVPHTERNKRCLEILDRFGLGSLVHRRPSRLSRGQQQRVAVARALVHKPRVVLGDELTANLDHKTGTELMDFLKELNSNYGITILYSTHDPVMMSRASRILRLEDGKLVEDRKT